MEKAFLCHSSTDKEYVGGVAKRLGRAHVVYDAMTFRAGHDFRKSIADGLDRSALFVFFVSRESLSSVWCKFELDETHFRLVTGEIQGALVIIIDPTVTFAELPAWMQRIRAIVQTRPVQAAREVERELFAIVPTSLATKPFVGRQSLLEEFVQFLAVRAEFGPRVFIVSGLEGLGRRSYLSRALLDNLGLTLGPFRVVDATSTIDDLFVWLLDETADVMTRDELAREVKAFQSIDAQAQVGEVLNRLRLICEGRFVPCLINRGGMLGDDGEICEPYSSILRGFATDDDAYLAIVDTRAPRIADRPYAKRTTQQRLQPLRPAEARVLLQQLLRRDGIAVKDSHLDELVPYVDGYPPAAYFVTQQAKSYGVETTIADKSLLVDFKVKRFTRFLSDLKLLQPEWDVLAYLASEQVVPLAAIAASLGRDAGDVAQVVRKLIDNSLVIVADDNLAISPPIRDAITRARGHISAENYSKILERLTQAFWSGESVAPSIEVVDATLHAVARSGSKDFDPYNDLVRVSIVHRLARESYHRRDYDDAFEYARRADRMGARHFDVLAIMFKALVKLERWGDAEQMLARIKATGNRQYWFLKGFLHRRRREYDQARLAYEQAFEAGDNGFALHRDYADVLHRLGRLSDATEQIRNLLARGTENVFVLDLALRIYADSLKRNEDVGMTAEEVEKYLHELDRFDIDRRFINHRRATILAAQGQIVDAIEYADAACISDPQSFEAFSLRVGLLVEAGRLRDAESALQELNARFKIGQDVQLGLAIKLECSRGDWRRALAIWNRLHDRERPVHQVLLLGIKRLQAADKDLSLAERNSADAKASEIRERLDSIDEGLGPEYDED